MPLSHQGRAVIVGRLARAFPSVADRLRVIASAGAGDLQATGDPDTAWRLIIEEAEDRGMLARIVDAAAREDASFAGMAVDIAAGREPSALPRQMILIGLAGVAATLAIGIAVVAWTGAGAAKDEIISQAALVSATPAPDTTPATAPSPPAPVVETPDPGAPAPTIDEPASTAVVPVRAPAVAEAPAPVSKCGNRDNNGRIGWVYGGESEPHVADGIVVQRGSGNLRADYPHAENGWNAHARVRC